MPKIKAKVSGKGNAPLTATLLSKTRLCDFYAQGRCTRGDACTFAHGIGEITARPDFSCTQVCRSFKTTGRCAMGDACQFAHAAGNLRKWGHCMSDARRASPAAVPDVLRGQRRHGAGEGTASTSSAAAGSEEEEEASLIELTFHAVRAWQEHSAALESPGTTAGPPRLTASALDDAHRYYRDHSAVQGEDRIYDRRYHSLMPAKVELANDVPHAPPQPPPPPQRWLGEPAAGEKVAPGLPWRRPLGAF